MDDPKFSFQRQGEERRRRQLIPPSLKRKPPSWKIHGDDEPKAIDRWRVEYDAAGKICLCEEVVPPAILPSAPVQASTRSRFTMRLREECFVGGHACEPGCKVICFGPSAADLFPRASIEEEERNSF